MEYAVGQPQLNTKFRLSQLVIGVVHYVVGLRSCLPVQTQSLGLLC